jgi:hypothetical protein
MLLDKDVGRVLPRCKVVVIWGENTLWEMVGAAWAVEKVYKEREAVGQVGRTLEVVEMPGANHFVRLVPFLDYHFWAALKLACMYSPIGMNLRRWFSFYRLLCKVAVLQISTQN